jgi:aryl-alcohol dehydrogenase-like predicted oxidoreductase
VSPTTWIVAWDEMERILRSEPLDFIQIHYSINAPAAAETVLPLARDKGVAVLINRAFDDGKLFGRVKDKPLPGWAPEVGVESWRRCSSSSPSATRR